MQPPSQLAPHASRLVDWDVVVLGGANYDYTARGPELPGPGATVQGDTLVEGPGGKGANQAVAAARLGARVALIARLGTDARGDALLAALQAEGVATDFVVRDSAAPTGVALIYVDKRGEKAILAVPGANRNLCVPDIQAARAALSHTRMLLGQLEAPLDCLQEAAQIARAAGARVVLDPAPPEPLPDGFLHLVDVIRPNADEATLLTGIKVTDRGSAAQAARQLIARGVGAAVVQAGDEGNLLVWPDGERLLPRIEVPTVDATGAGDALAAALAVALAEGHPMEQAGPFASATAALATTAMGAQAGLPRRDAVLDLLTRSGYAAVADALRP